MPTLARLVFAQVKVVDNMVFGIEQTGFESGSVGSHLSVTSDIFFYLSKPLFPH